MTHRILDIRRMATRPESILGFSLDFPATGETRGGSVLDIGGWVVGCPTVRHVELWADDEVMIRRIPVGVARPDVETYLTGIPDARQSGFYGQVSVYGLAPEVTLSVWAGHADGTSTPLASVQVQRSAPDLTAPALSSPGAGAPSASALQPILLTAIGRSGTTWLMQLLGEHPAVVIYPSHPFEMHAFTYWMQAFRVLSAPADPVGSSHPDTFWFDHSKIGHFPFHSPELNHQPGYAGWFDQTYSPDLAQFCRNATDSFYRQVATQAGKVQPRCFAEKLVLPYSAWLAWELYPSAREIFLVRDFRDVLASILAFNRKRGFDSFGRERVSTDEDYAAWLCKEIKTLARNWERRSDRALLVRYEDLLTSPRRELERLLRHVGIDDSPATVEGMLHRATQTSDQSQHHRTSDSPGQSIGRWQSDLPAHLQAVVNDLFKPMLRQFGYEP